MWVLLYVNYRRVGDNMKKRYCIGLCFLLIVCLLLLSACGSSMQGASAKKSAQATNAAEETTGTQVNINSASANSPQEILFNWDYSFYRFHMRKPIPAFDGIKKYTYEDISQVTEQLMDGHSCDVQCRVNSDGEQLCLQEKAVESLSLSKEYFDTHTLFSVELPSPSRTRTSEVTDVRYEGEELKIYIANLYTKGVAGDSGDGNIQCFIELDTAIPDGTRVKLVFEDQWVDLDEFEEKVNAFTDRVVYLYERGRPS